MSFTLPSLPYSYGALAERGMCQETLELHHGKHHQAYITALNGLVEKNDALKGKSLEELIALSSGKEELTPVFNNAGQHWNHSFFWNSLSADKGGVIPPALEQKLVADFGGVEQFKAQFKAAALGQFGSGWAWLVLAKDGKPRFVWTDTRPDATTYITLILAAIAEQQRWRAQYQAAKEAAGAVDNRSAEPP